MTASVDIITEVKKDILTVPLASVTTRVPGEKKMSAEEESESEDDDDDDPTIKKEAEEVVFRFSEGMAELVQVKTGISDFERIEIVEGLEEGEIVISGPFLAVSKRLNDGDLVESDDKKDEEDSSEEED